jgi:UDP-glucose 4-epimerase
MSELCLVTGGAGFIGSHLVEELSRQGRSVRVLDDFSTGQRSNLEHIRPTPEVVQADLADEAAVRQAMAGVRVVFHLGAVASVTKSVEDPLASHRVCATGTVNVLDAARRAGVRRFVVAASSSAYGIPAGDVQTEDDPLRALSPYAAAKLASEFYAQAFAACFALETVCLRFFNIFGPRQRADSPYSGVIAIFMDAMRHGRTPTIHGDGKQTRDFTYVANAVQALIKAADVPGVSGKSYNVGTGRRVNLLELVAALNHLLGTTIVSQHGPPRPGDVRHSCADIRRARAELGYEPTVTFEEGLKRLLAAEAGN